MFFSASAQVVTHDLNFDYENIGKSITYFKDESAKLSLAQIKAIDASGKFVPGKQDILNFGNSTAATWIKINHIHTSLSRSYLIVDAPNIEHIDCYILSKELILNHMKSGSLSYPAPGVTIESNFVFKLPDGKNDSVSSIYLRLKTNNIMLVPLKLATPEAIMRGKAIKDRIEYVYIGVLIALLLFNLFLFTSLKDTTYLYYTAYVLTLSSYLLIYIRGYGFLFGDELRILFSYHPHVFLSFSMVTSLIFCKKFLNLEHTVPWMLKIYYFLGCCAIVLFFTSVSGNKSLSASIAQVMTFTVSIVLWISGIIAYVKGHKPAKYYIIAWFFIWLTVGIVTFSLAGVLETNEFTMQLIPIGSTLELLLLSFALGDRYRIIIKTEQDVRDENLVLVQDQKQRLEDLVQKRTELLTKTIAELESSNAVKNKLFSIIAHDLRSPLNSLMSILSLNDVDALTMEDIQHMLKENKKNIETIYNTLNNLLYWAKSQMGGIVTDPVSFDLKVLIDELMLVYSPLMRKKDITPEVHIAGSFPVYADENQIRLVLRNLIDNAIKFTSKGQLVTLSLNPIGNDVQVCVSNPLDDPADVDISNMTGHRIVHSSYGTDQEKGVGLGLHLCREYISSNGGELKIKQDGGVISFCFLIPKGKD
ncbi:sensor histidine kinase [Pedobacter metabolipauper]|uniref:sensor histidine kinase n=1 Tax=Pedobacter metabolipauper TaxID=425513 RepID=UPI001FB58218|nr:sensor histidine kinase [Pedobacter metabolipauper]